MKIMLFVCLLLMGRLSHAQTTEAAEPFRGANTIMVHTPDSMSAALNKLARVLVLQGYTIDKLDLTLGYLVTKGQPVGQITPAIYTYKAVAIPEGQGSALRITGEYSFPAGLRTITESMFWVKGNLPHAKQCFTGAEKAALSYAGGRVGYLLQP